MRLVDIAHARAGMVLAGALLDAQGMTLLPAGAVLSESALNALRRRGIVQMQIRGDDLAADGDGQAAPVRVSEEDIQARLDVLFRHFPAGSGTMLRDILAQFQREKTA